MPRRAVAAARVRGAGEALLRLACAAAWLAPLAAAAAPGCGEHGLVARAWKRPAQAGPQATPDATAYPYPQVRHAVMLLVHGRPRILHECFAAGAPKPLFWLRMD